MSHDFDDLTVSRLYEAAAGLIPWSEALAGLHAAMNVAGLQLVMVEKSVGRLIFSEQPIAAFSPTVIDGTLDHVREYHRCDPHMLRAASLPVGKIMHSADEFPIAQYRTHPFYRDYWAAYNIRSLLAAKVAEDERHVVMLGMTRSFDQPPYRFGDMQLLGRYVHHLVSAWRIGKDFQKQYISASAGRSVMEGSSRPMIQLGKGEEILSTNAAAAELLGTGKLLYSDSGILRCRSAAAGSALQRAIKRLGLDGQTKSDLSATQRLALRLPGAGVGSCDLLCSLWSMRPEATMCFFGLEPMALLTVFSPHSGLRVDPMFLASMFDLTPAEARVASALTEGRGVKAVAAEFRVAPETVRAQIKSLFAKTNTHRQAELVALLLRATAA